MSFMLHKMRGSVGQSNGTCPICKNVAYPLESIIANGYSFHRSCLRCIECKRSLNVSNYKLKPNTTLIYCEAHLPKSIGKEGAITSKLLIGRRKSSNISTDVLLASPSNMDGKSQSPTSRMGTLVSQKVQAFSALSESSSTPFVATRSSSPTSSVHSPQVSNNSLQTSREMLPKSEPEQTHTIRNSKLINTTSKNMETSSPEGTNFQLSSASRTISPSNIIPNATSSPNSDDQYSNHSLAPKNNLTETLASVTPPRNATTALSKASPTKSSREALTKSASLSSLGSAEDGSEISSLAKLNNRALWHISYSNLVASILTGQESVALDISNSDANDDEASIREIEPSKSVTGTSDNGKLRTENVSEPAQVSRKISPINTSVQTLSSNNTSSIASSPLFKSIQAKIYQLFEEFLTRCDNLVSTYETMSSNSTIKKHSGDLIGAVFKQLITTINNIIVCIAPVVDTTSFNTVSTELARMEAAVGIEMDQIKINGNFPMGCLNALRATLSKAKQEIEQLLTAYDDTEQRLLVKAMENYNVETRSPAQPLVTYFGYQLEHIDEDADYFRKYFFEQEHKTFFGTVDKLGQVIISVKHEVCQPGDMQVFRVIMRSKTSADTRLTIPVAEIPQSTILRYKGVSKALLAMLHPQIQPGKLRKVQFESLPRKLIALDELQLVMRYKFGVLYCRDGQKTEEEMYNNETGSSSFDEFLTILGNRVDLKGFVGFAAGLDTKNEQTGSETITTKWRQYEVTYHVSTLLPFFKSDKQQIQRKRHIGNDIVTLVFMDGDAQFNPAIIRSQFLNVFIIVKSESYEDGKKGYRVAIARNSEVPDFGPPLPTDSLFFDRMEFREFLLAKMINGENAAYKAPRFSRPHLRTRHMMMDDILQDFSASPQMPRVEKEFNDRNSTASNSSGTTLTISSLTSPDSHINDHATKEVSIGPAAGRKKNSVYLFPQFQRRTSSGVSNSIASSKTLPEDQEISEHEDEDDVKVSGDVTITSPSSSSTAVPGSSPALSPFVPVSHNINVVSLNPNSAAPSAAASPRLGGSNPNLAANFPSDTLSDSSIRKSESDEAIEENDPLKTARRSLMFSIKGASSKASNGKLDETTSGGGKRNKVSTEILTSEENRRPIANLFKR